MNSELHFTMLLESLHVKIVMSLYFYTVFSHRPFRDCIDEADFSTVMGPGLEKLAPSGKWPEKFKNNFAENFDH